MAWDGGLEIGVMTTNPDGMELPSCASFMRNGVWIMESVDVRKDSDRIVHDYVRDLQKLSLKDRVGVMRTSNNELVFYLNGKNQGVAARNMPKPLWALLDLYGRCVQVSICKNYAFRVIERKPSSVKRLNIDGMSLFAREREIAAALPNRFGSVPSKNMTIVFDQAAKHRLSTHSTATVVASPNDCAIYKNLANTFATATFDSYDINDRLRFHARCGSLVKLSTNCRSAERRRPLDEFNNGVVMTHRPLKDDELFAIRIDKLVDKWSGSIEVGVTTHNPSTLLFPATMTNMRSGTFMMSGSGILANGKGTRRQYGEFNLDELREGDRVGMMRTSTGNLHYYINGQDQGVAATRVAATVWGVIDLYGMTTKVTIVDHDERESQNLITRRNNLSISTNLMNLSSPDQAEDSEISQVPSCRPNADEYEERNDDVLTFHPVCGTQATVAANGRKAYRPNAADDFNNGVVLTRRPLRPNELFQVRLDSVVSKWAGSVEMGVTTYSAEELDFPFTMTNVRSGTWMMTGNGVMHNGITVFEQYGQNLDRMQVGDRVGVMRRDDGTLHFFVNGVDQGPAAQNVPEKVYGVIDLYGQAAMASIVDGRDFASPDTVGNSTISNTTLYGDPPLRFHSVHGKNASISNGGITATRPNSLAEFNEAVVFSNRPLRQRELFEVVLDSFVTHWSGNIEIGVISMRPEELQLTANASDLKANDAIILCGSLVLCNRKTVRTHPLIDLDILAVGSRVGVMRVADAIHFFIDGVDKGSVAECRAANIWAVVDLYGQCAQVSITQPQPDMRAPYATSENSQSCQATSVIQPMGMENKHRWTRISGNVNLSQNWTVATRSNINQSASMHSTVFSEPPLVVGVPFEIKITMQNPMLAGSLSVGITDLNLTDTYMRRNQLLGIKSIPANVWYVSGNKVYHNNNILQQCKVSLDWLRMGDIISLELMPTRNLRFLINSEDMQVELPNMPNVSMK